MLNFQHIDEMQLGTEKVGDMAKGCQAIAVHTVNFNDPGETAFYASLPGDGETRKECRPNRAANKEHLIASLLDHVVAMKNPPCQYRHLFDRAALPVQVAYSPLGRPHLLVGEIPGPAISFSEGGGRVWAALGGDASDIGIDVAMADEFQEKYPRHRVFHDHELDHALKLTKEDVAKASALLWSIKEAVVKALGCAFHLVAPLQVYVYPSVGESSGYMFPVRISAKTQVRSLLGSGRSLWVRSFPLEKMWLSIALLSRQSRQGDIRDFQTKALQRKNVDS